MSKSSSTRALPVHRPSRTNTPRTGSQDELQTRMGVPREHCPCTGSRFAVLSHASERLPQNVLGGVAHAGRRVVNARCVRRQHVRNSDLGWSTVKKVDVAIALCK